MVKRDRRINMAKVKCTYCHKEFDVDIDGEFDIDDLAIQDELSKTGHAFGIDHSQTEFVLCEDCTIKVAQE